MEFIVFWVASTLAVFFTMFIIFRLDHKYADGSFREFIKEIWVIVIVLLIIPFINILAVTVGVMMFSIIFVCELVDKHNLDGNKIIKIIFFIKDDK